VSEVRFKQHAGVAEGGKSLYDPKMDAGGMLDLETESRLQAVFVVAGPQEIPTGTLALLSRLTQHDGPVRHDFAALERAYRFLVRLTNRAHLVLDRPVSRVPSEGPAADRLARTLGFEGDAPARLLWEAYRGVLAEGARVCARLAEARRGSMSRG
jgi:glutamine synthetase adenylyltransferase